MYDKMKVKDAPDVVLIAELLKRNNPGKAICFKSNYVTPHFTSILGVGKDHTAYLTIDEDSVNALHGLLYPLLQL